MVDAWYQCTLMCKGAYGEGTRDIGLLLSVWRRGVSIILLLAGLLQRPHGAVV